MIGFNYHVSLYNGPAGKKYSFFYSGYSCLHLQVHNLTIVGPLMPACAYLLTIYAGCIENAWSFHGVYYGYRTYSEVQAGRHSWL
jgi:hypothetical protein